SLHDFRSTLVHELSHALLVLLGLSLYSQRGHSILIHVGRIEIHVAGFVWHRLSQNLEREHAVQIFGEELLVLSTPGWYLVGAKVVALERVPLAWRPDERTTDEELVIRQLVLQLCGV